MNTPTYLDQILRSHRDAAAADARSVDALVDQARRRPPTRDFSAALHRDGVGVIAEVKRASPSKGPLAPDLDPAALAAAYAAGGAACVSVLTDERFFGARADDLARARAAVDLPVLRKDFTVCLADVADARIMGADAVLLIVAALDPVQLGDLHDAALDLGLAALVEVHDEAEAEAAIEAGARNIGVNQRDLVTFAVDADRAVRVAGSLPDTVVRVAESGISGPEDIPRLREAGFDAVLVGESLVRSPDATDAVADLVRAGAP